MLEKKKEYHRSQSIKDGIEGKIRSTARIPLQESVPLQYKMTFVNGRTQHHAFYPVTILVPELSEHYVFLLESYQHSSARLYDPDAFNGRKTPNTLPFETFIEEEGEQIIALRVRESDISKARLDNSLSDILGSGRFVTPELAQEIRRSNAQFNDNIVMERMLQYEEWRQSRKYGR